MTTTYVELYFLLGFMYSLGAYAMHTELREYLPQKYSMSGIFLPLWVLTAITIMWPIIIIDTLYTLVRRKL